MILGLVCARKGSSMKDKNLRRLDGEALIERAIRLAFEAGCDDVAVSTDYRPGIDFDPLGATHIERPDSLAGPEVGKWAVYRHAAAMYGGEWPALRPSAVVDVDVTRPLRTADTIRACIAKLETDPVVMAVARGDKHPAFDILRWTDDGLELYERSTYTARQQVPTVWLHAGVYAVRADALYHRDHHFEGPVAGVEVHRIESLDIDDELDWAVVELLALSTVRIAPAA